MTRIGFAAVIAACVWMAGFSAVQGADKWPVPGNPVEADPFKQQPVEVALQLGGHGDRMVILSQQFVFQTGKLYRLTIKNANTVTHIFGTGAFGGYGVDIAIVDVGTGDYRTRDGGPPGEEYTTPDIVIEPGGVAVLEFVPVVEGEYKVGCSDPKHADAGMTATFIITSRGEPLG